MNQKRKGNQEINNQYNQQTEKKLKIEKEENDSYYEDEDDEELSNDGSQMERENSYKTPANDDYRSPDNFRTPMSSTASKSKARHDNSLSVLTKKFVSLIKSSHNQQIDLNDTVKALSVQKRRIYDITNVLEGIGYIEKCHKNKIKWVGGTEDPELEKEIKDMKKELEQLTEEEKQMDYWIQYLHDGLNNSFLNNEEQSKYTYLTYEDFKTLSKLSNEQNDEALFIITAPKGTTLEVPMLESEISQEYPHQLYLNSKSEEIQIYLCSDENYPLEYSSKNKQKQQ